MDARITSRKPDITRNFDWLRFQIGKSKYIAKAVGQEVWGIYRVYKTAPSRLLPPKKENEIAAVAKALLANDKLKAMQE